MLVPVRSAGRGEDDGQEAAIRARQRTENAAAIRARQRTGNAAAIRARQRTDEHRNVAIEDHIMKRRAAVGASG